MGDEQAGFLAERREDGESLALDLANLSTESIVACNADGIVSLWSAKAGQLYGYSAQQAVGKNLNILLHTRHPYGLDSIQAEFQRDGQWSGELFRTTSTGDEVKVEAHWAMRSRANGPPIGFVERSHDQTADEAAKRETEATAHRYWNLFHAMAASFWEMDFSDVRKMIGGLLESGVTDLRGYFGEHPEFIDQAIAATRIVDVNETTVIMFRAPSREAIMELPLGWEWPEESRHVYAEALLKAFERADRYIAEVRLQRWDGTLMDALFTVCWPSNHKARGTVLVGVIDISDRVEAFRRLAESESRYRGVFDHMPVGLFQLDNHDYLAWIRELRAGGVENLERYICDDPEAFERASRLIKIAAANPHAVKILGAGSEADMIGSIAPWWRNSLDDLKIVIGSRLAGKTSISIETQLFTPDHTPVDVIFTIAFSPELDAKGIAVAGIVDISAQKEAVAALAESESRYRALVEYMPIGICELDTRRQLQRLSELKASGVDDPSKAVLADPALAEELADLITIKNANAAALTILEADELDAVKGPIAPFWANSMGTLQRVAAARLAGKRSFAEDTVGTTLKGHRFDTHVTVAFPPELDSRGISVVAFLDVTEQKRITKELEAREQRFHALFDNMPISIMELDSSGLLLELERLRESGIVDIADHLDKDPDAIMPLMLASKPILANAEAVRQYEAADVHSLLAAPVSIYFQMSPDTFKRSVQARLRGELSYSEEARLTTVLGTEFEGLFTIAFIAGPDGSQTSIVGVTDISKLKSAMAELATSEARFRNLFDNMPVALSQLDMADLQTWLAETAQNVDNLPDHLEQNPALAAEIGKRVRIEESNKEALRLFGAENSDAMPETIEPFWQVRPETILRSTVARLRGAPAFSEETQIVNRRGDVVDVMYTIGYPAALVERSINIVGLVDLSERTRAARALTLSEGRYRELFQQIPVGLWRLNPERLTSLFRGLKSQGIKDLDAYFDAHPGFLYQCMDSLMIIEANAAAARTVGVAHADLLSGQSVLPFWKDFPDIFRHAMIARWSGLLTYAEEGKMGSASGDGVDVAFQVSYPGSALDDISVVTTMDIRDRRRAEVRLQQFQSEFSHAARVSTLGELAASIAHEVNQPLAAIAALAQASLRWLRRDEPDLEELKALSEQIIDDGRRAGEIIARIRGMAMKRDPAFVYLDVNELIKEALLIVQHEAESHGIKIQQRLTAKLPPVFGDRVQLQQVVVNLTLNAVQAITSGAGQPKSISVNTTIRDRDLLVEVSDSGPGIASEAIDHLFTGFFTTKEHGMGIGLAICRSIIEAHGGFISAENKSAGGATFSFTLPIEPPGVPAAMST
ncbi:hypothetical protein AYR46_20225 [Sphingobium yanoikuyae]|uniref:PAS domain S-box protein n=1 Tax=Sphingobium yanoikuyae TaxID=13690 RepID=UPI0007A7552C|nr:PAS domain S-box protein [Sphingobium yanoikuyae]KZC75997.1 hypothetical protein AYR46_20225 [Sphingobium yanoikuyae]